ncbi:hypothetical protein VPH35_104905 [Triticum aestivum]
MFRASLYVSSKNMSKISEYFALPWCLVCLLHNPFLFCFSFQARTRLGTYVYNEVLSLHIYAVAATQANTHSGNMSPTSPRSRIVYSGYSVPQALQNNAQSNFSSGHDSLKLLSSILKKRLTQINGHAPCTYKNS